MIDTYDVYGANLHKLVPPRTHLVHDNHGWSAMLLDGNVVPDVFDLEAVFNEALTVRRSIHLVFKDQVAIDRFLADTDPFLEPIQRFVSTVREYRGYLVMTLDELSAGLGYDLNQEVLGNGYPWFTLMNLAVVPERSAMDKQASNVAGNLLAHKIFLDWNIARFFEDDLFRFFLLHELARLDVLRRLANGEDQSFLRGETVEYLQYPGGVKFINIDMESDITGSFHVAPNDGSPAFFVNGWEHPYSHSTWHKRVGFRCEIPKSVQIASLPLNWPAGGGSTARYPMVSVRPMPVDVALSGS